tara:strand:- start:3897 stop:4157 length:261 start_codon:yes stop_codon:yes gene_type:complete
METLKKSEKKEILEQVRESYKIGISGLESFVKDYQGGEKEKNYLDCVLNKIYEINRKGSNYRIIAIDSELVKELLNVDGNGAIPKS